MSSAASKRAQRRAARVERVVVGDIVWRLVSKEKVERPYEFEVRDGLIVMRGVNVDAYCYVMVCACGRQRYAKPNGLHEVRLCRVCQHRHRNEGKRRT